MTSIPLVRILRGVIKTWNQDLRSFILNNSIVKQHKHYPQKQYQHQHQSKINITIFLKNLQEQWPQQFYFANKTTLLQPILVIWSNLFQMLM